MKNWLGLDYVQLRYRFWMGLDGIWLGLGYVHARFRLGYV